VECPCQHFRDFLPPHFDICTSRYDAGFESRPWDQLFWQLAWVSSVALGKLWDSILK
jgi:hypothetical protein